MADLRGLTPEDVARRAAARAKDDRDRGVNREEGEYDARLALDVAELVRQKQRELRELLCAVVIRHGGSVSVNDRDLAAARGAEFGVWREEHRHATLIQAREGR